MNIKIYEQFQNDVLIIVDVQKSFKKFFNNKYITQLKKYCNSFPEVYQIWDNHYKGKNVDKSFLYEKNPLINSNDLWDFPNELMKIEKRYNYNVNTDFYKNILTEEVYKEIKEKDKNKHLQKGDLFQTTKNTYLVYTGNKHRFFHISIKMTNLFSSLRGKNIIMVGGSKGECLQDVFIAAEAFNLKVSLNNNFIWSATHCPIK